MYLSFHLEIETTFVAQKLNFSLESIFLGLILDAFVVRCVRVCWLLKMIYVATGAD
jgi:hypothetical protein